MKLQELPRIRAVGYFPAEWKVSLAKQYDACSYRRGRAALTTTSELGGRSEPTLPPWTVTRLLLITVINSSGSWMCTDGQNG